MPTGEIPKKAVELIETVGDWYNRMEGCLENHDAQPHVFGITDISDVVINKKDGKTYKNFTIADAADNVWVFDAEYSTVVTTVNGLELFMGTRGLLYPEVILVNDNVNVAPLLPRLTESNCYIILFRQFHLVSLILGELIGKDRSLGDSLGICSRDGG